MKTSIKETVKRLNVPCFKIVLALGILCLQPLAHADQEPAPEVNQESASQAKQELTPQTEKAELGRFRLLKFGITERFTSLNTFTGVNLSTLLSWNPQYELFPWLKLEGQLGGTIQSSNLGKFLTLRYQAGVSFHNLFDSNDRFVPEVLAGAETWAISAGGTYFAGSINLHYRFKFQDAGYFNFFDAVHIGYQWLPGAPGSTQQYTVGIRINPDAKLAPEGRS